MRARVSSSHLSIRSSVALVCLLVAAACGGSGGGGKVYTVTAVAGAGGSISPASAKVKDGETAAFTVTAEEGHRIGTVTGCGGSLSGNTWTTGPVTADCTVTASFVATHTVSTVAGAGGSLSPASRTVDDGATASFTVAVDDGYRLDSVSGCGGSLSGSTYTTGAVTADCTVTASFILTHTVAASAGAGGTITPPTRVVDDGATASFTVTADAGHRIGTVTGCGGTLSGDTYTTGAITTDCTVTASFVVTHTVSTVAGAGGTISPESRIVDDGATTTFTVTPDAHYLAGASGCGGTLTGTTYTTGAITADCTVTAGFGLVSLALAPLSVKTFHFTWAEVAGATGYELYEDPDGTSDYTSVATPAGTSADLLVPLHRRLQASYVLRACNDAGCADSSPAAVSDHLAGAVGYVKASNTAADDGFGWAVALSGDGSTMAVGAPYEVDGTGAVYVFTRSGGTWVEQAYLTASNAQPADSFGYSIGLSEDGNTLAVGAYGEDGGNGDPLNNAASGSGAVYVFTRSGTAWTQQAYLKASNPGNGDSFGFAVALSADGATLAAGAAAPIPGVMSGESSSATCIDGNQALNDAPASGAVYVFARTGTTWSQQAYVKASNTGAGDYFGVSVALSGDGDTLAVGALDEASSATGIDGNERLNDAAASGAVYVFARSSDTWSQQAYVKASNTGAYDLFGASVTLSSDGNTLAVGAYGEASSATGVGGDQANDDARGSGAVYVFGRSGSTWSQQAYVKPSNTQANQEFGGAVALSLDGASLAVGALQEASEATGVGGDQASAAAPGSGAVYVFGRSGGAWSQQAYVKASNTETDDFFGGAVALSSDGATLAVGADGESSAATGVGGDQTDNSALQSGAVYLY